MLILLLMCLLLSKHLIFDFIWQTQIELKYKQYPWSIGSLLHAFKHQMGTFVAVYLVHCDIKLAFALSLLDFFIHNHVDWIKNKTKFTPDQKIYWAAFGIDQYVHQLTYLIITFLAMTWTTLQ